MKKKRLVDCLQTTVRNTIAQIFLAVAFTFVTLASSVEAQILDKPISLSIDNAEIRVVLLQIQKQVDVKFIYSSEAIQASRKTSVHVSNKKLREILDLVFSPLQIQYKVKNDRILLFRSDQSMAAPPSFGGKPAGEPASTAAQFTVRGVVTNNKKEGIPGASVLVKGTTMGTTTDAEGKYSLSVPDEHATGTLVFSFIGYLKEEVPIGRQTTLNMQLIEDISVLSEVVVNGYQQIKKESFTGTSITVTNDQLKSVNPVNFLQSIQAYDPSFRVAQDNIFGSNPNKMPDITIRGATGLPSLGSSQSSTDQTMISRNNLRNNPNLPTFILNGMEVSVQTIYDMDWSRLESFTILKDAAATAVYGSRAANGVVVIKTKTPKEGKLSISYTHDLTIAGPDLRVYKVLHAEDKLEYERLAGLYDSQKQYGSPLELQTQYYRKKKNVVSGIDTYWLSEPVETALGHSHNLGVDGGSATLQYSITARYQDLKGVMKGSDRTRYGLDVNLFYHLNDKIHFSNTLTVSEVQSKESPYGRFEDYIRMNPYFPRTDSNGHILQAVDTWAKDANNSDVVLNPAYDATLSNFDKGKYTQIINSFSGRWRITNGIELRGQMSITKQRSTSDRFKSPFANEYYTYKGDDIKKRGEYQYGSTDEDTYDGNLVANFTKVVDKHVVNATLGVNLRDYSSDFRGFRAVGFMNDRFDNINFANGYRDGDSPEGAFNQERLLGPFLNVNYSFADKYLLDVAGRMDGSSKFGTDNKYAPFWAVGVGWNIHKEDFLASSSFINQLKVRATTGLTGEVSFESYLVKTTYEYYNDWYSSGLAAIHKGYGNEGLKWQRTQNYDLGLEMSLWKNRIYFSPRYYYKLTKDLLADIVVPPSMGFASYKANLGEMENRGFEADLRVILVRSKDWNFSLSLRPVRNINTIKKVSESLKKYNDEVDKQQDQEEYKGTPLPRFREGESLNTIYAVRSLGIDPENGREIYVKKDGTLTHEFSVKDIVAVGDATPDMEGYIGGMLSYKSFSLSVSLYNKFGGDLYNQTLIDRVENADPRYNVDERVLSDRWKKPGDQALFKDIANRESTRATSRFIQRDEVVELKSANLSYDAPQTLASRFKMQSLRLMVTMNDIWRWSAVKMERGIDFPFARTVTFTLQTRF